MEVLLICHERTNPGLQLNLPPLHVLHLLLESEIILSMLLILVFVEIGFWIRVSRHDLRLGQLGLQALVIIL